MPRVAKWVADTFEHVLSSKYLTVKVGAVVRLSTQVKKIRFLGDFKKINFAIGYAVSFRVNDNDFRHYTPSYFDPEAGICDIIFHLHGRGPGSDFAEKLQPGDLLKMVMPGGRKLYDQQDQTHFFFGDETAIGLFLAMSKAVKSNGQRYMGILELDEQNFSIPEQLNLSTRIVLKSNPDPEFNLKSCLENVMTYTPGCLRDAVFYLIGNVASLKHFRLMLKELNISPKKIKVQGYWAEGRYGM